MTGQKARSSMRTRLASPEGPSSSDRLILLLMRIATWNVNSLKARLEKVTWWLDRARPDVLMMQETKLTDAAAPIAEFGAAGNRQSLTPVTSLIDVQRQF